MPNYIPWRFPILPTEKLTEQFQGLFARDRYLFGCFHADFVRADDVVFDAPSERFLFVMVERVLGSVRVDDDIAT
jgi:hypothetical protein